MLFICYFFIINCVLVFFQHDRFHMVAQHLCNRENGTSWLSVFARCRMERERVRYVKSVLAFHDSDSTDQ